MAGSGRERWLHAGQELLRAGGSPAVKLEPLARVTGLTIGSFYHHFSNMAAYLEALASFYGTAQVDTVLAGVADLEPVPRLRALMDISRDAAMGPLDAAMRDWAGHAPAAAAAVRAADRALLQFLARTFGELGHDRDSAQLRALTLLSVGVARIHSPWRIAAAGSNDRLLAMLAAGD